MKRKLRMGLGITIAIIVAAAIVVMVLPGIAEARRGGGQGINGQGPSGTPGQTLGQNQDQDLRQAGEQGSEDCEAEGNALNGRQGRQGRAGGRGGNGQDAGERQAGSGGLGQSQGSSWGTNGEKAYDADLSESEIEALMLALEDEYKAWTVYEQVLTDHGSVRPFANIQRAEENHIAALVSLFEKYGLEVPANDWIGGVPSFETVSEACAGGVQAEVENAALYDQLFAMVDNPDIIRVFESLQWASDAKHLPAFESCAD